MIADNEWSQRPSRLLYFRLNFDEVILFLISFSGSYLRIHNFLLKNWKHIHVNYFIFQTSFLCGKWCFPYLEERETETQIIVTSKVLSNRTRTWTQRDRNLYFLYIKDSFPLLTVALNLRVLLCRTLSSPVFLWVLFTFSRWDIQDIIAFSFDDCIIDMDLLFHIELVGNKNPTIPNPYHLFFS